MRKLTLAIAALCLTAPALAQDVPTAGPGAEPRAEVFAGYSYAHLGDEDLPYGWNLAAAYNLNRRLAVVVDGSGQYGSVQGVELDQLTLTAGPSGTFGRGGPASVFVHALFGLVRTSAGISVLGVTISESRSDFGMLFGGGVDVKLGAKLAFRLQGDYERIQADEGGEDGYRLSAGVVLRVGKR
jgi:opacity protein-like surface antigen